MTLANVGHIPYELDFSRRVEGGQVWYVLTESWGHVYRELTKSRSLRELQSVVPAIRARKPDRVTRGRFPEKEVARDEIC